MQILGFIDDLIFSPGRYLADWILPVLGAILLVGGAVTGSVSDLRWGTAILVGSVIYLGFRLVRRIRTRRQLPPRPPGSHRT
jgi:hypothetical protein